MSRPVTSPVSARTRRENIFDTVDRLINGDPLESAEVDQRDLLCALCAVRNEEIVRNRTPRVERSTSLIREIEASMTPPPVRKNGPRSPSSPKSSQSPFSPKSNRSAATSPKSVKSSTTTPKSNKTGSLTPTRKKVPIIKELSEEEFGHVSEIVDRLLEGEDMDITEILRQKIIFVVKRRREQCLDECNYLDVQLLDELMTSLRQKATPKRTWKEKVNDLKRACNVMQKKIGKLNSQRADALNQLFQEQQEDRDELENAMELEEHELCLAIPSMDEVKVASPKLTELRRAERRLASGGRYEEAMLLHLHADEVEEEERQKAIADYMQSSRAEMDRFLAYKQRAIATHEQKWENRRHILQRNWDRQITPLEAREARMQDEITSLWREHRNDRVDPII